MKVLIAADYEANYLTVAGLPIHVSPEAVAAAQQDAQALVRAIALEEATKVFSDRGPDGFATMAEPGPSIGGEPDPAAPPLPGVAE